jgi:diguanylate cyclase (GGDEF)-like protein
MNDDYRLYAHSQRFAALDETVAREFFDRGRVMGAGEGEVLFHRNDLSQEMFLLLEGEIDLSIYPSRPPKRIGPGILFGELSLAFPGHTRAATASCVVPCRLLRFDSEAFEWLVETAPRVAFSLIRSTLESIRDSERELIEELRAKNAELTKTLDYLRRTQQELGTKEILALTDELTGLYNRRCLNHQLPRHLERARLRDSFQIAILLVDIDYFKQVNDTWGHPAGDRVLQGVGAILREAVRQSDLPCRIGGDEFAILLLSCPGEITRVRGEGICERIAGTDFALPESGEPLRVTASLGATLYRSGESDEEFLARADQQLYEAKHRGRNQVCLGE